MKDKLNLPLEQKIRQEKWQESPCSLCYGSPCCTVVPLTSIRLSNRTDFINLTLLACYRNILLGLKKSGEWSVYYKMNCRYLDLKTTKCRIHSNGFQSLICKSYDAHNCWYKPAFKNGENEDIIFFDLSRLLELEKYTGFLKNGSIGNNIYRDNLINYFSDKPLKRVSELQYQQQFFNDFSLPFRACKAENYLFFPPFDKPARNIHFELTVFRLGFSGVYLSISDNSWAYLVCTEINTDLLNHLKEEYFPSLKAENCCFSFNMLNRTKWFNSKIGDKWIIAELNHIKPIKGIINYDNFGNIKKLPCTQEILALLRTIKPQKPDKAA